MSHFVKIINVCINNKLKKKQVLKHLVGGRVNRPIGVSLQCTRCLWAVPENTMNQPNVCLMLGQRRKRWISIGPTLG